MAYLRERKRRNRENSQNHLVPQYDCTEMRLVTTKSNLICLYVVFNHIRPLSLAKFYFDRKISIRLK